VSEGDKLESHSFHFLVFFLLRKDTLVVVVVSRVRIGLFPCLLDAVVLQVIILGQRVELLSEGQARCVQVRRVCVFKVLLLLLLGHRRLNHVLRQDLVHCKLQVIGIPGVQHITIRKYISRFS